MEQILLERQEANAQVLLGQLEPPKIVPLGLLDDPRQTAGLNLESSSPQPIMAILYNGI